MESSEPNLTAKEEDFDSKEDYLSEDDSNTEDTICLPPLLPNYSTLPNKAPSQGNTVV